MTAVLLKNTDADSAAPEAPRKDDGSGYRFEMIFEQGRSRAYADLTADLLDVLIAGYAAGDEIERLRARVEYATGLLAPLQAVVLSQADQQAIPAEDLEVLLRPRYEPVVVDEWSSEVPLVLIDLHYAPHSDIPAPLSTLGDTADPDNIWWLRPGAEWDLLVSLDRVGLIGLGENTDFIV